MSDVIVRAVEGVDLPAVARLAGMLVRYHHDLDPRRYLFIDQVEDGYARFLGAELTNPAAVVLCAIRQAEVVGYAYGTVEGRDWNALLDRHGAIHDVLVDPGARRSGIGEQLVLEACTRLGALGAPRVVLHTAVQNVAGQALFTKLGFRATMMEMTREG